MEDKEKDIENQNQLSESDMDLLSDSDIFGDNAINVNEASIEKEAVEMAKNSNK